MVFLSMVNRLVPVYLRVFVDGIMVTQFIKGNSGRGLKRVHTDIQFVSIELVRSPTRMDDGKEGIQKCAKVSLRSVVGSALDALGLSLEKMSRPLHASTISRTLSKAGSTSRTDDSSLLR